METEEAGLTGRAPLENTGVEPTYSSRLTLVVLPDVDGNEVRLGSLWAMKPCVVAFLRHYG